MGDGKIGKNSNIGAGTIFCNYDGTSKHKINIASKTFVGSNVSLVAHLEIGENVIIGSGAQIIGPIKVGSGSRIAANAVVVKDSEILNPEGLRNEKDNTINSSSRFTDKRKGYGTFARN